MRQTDAIPEATQTAKKQLAAGDISGAERLLFQQLQLTPQIVKPTITIASAYVIWRGYQMLKASSKRS